jgi:hypothetical protein
MQESPCSFLHVPSLKESLLTTQQKIAGSGFGVFAALAILLLIMYFPIAPSRESEASFMPDDNDTGFLVKGGIRRPATEYVSEGKEKRWGEPDQLSHIKEKGIDGYGWMPAFDPTDGTMVREALSEIQKNEGKSLFAEQEVFREEEYKQDSTAYLNRYEPFRVFSPAQPGDGVPVLIRVTDRDVTLTQGEAVALVVEGAPNMPVTFTSFDGGLFENDLPSTTVESDEKGHARVSFTCTPGVIAAVRVLASSPAATGIVEFQITANLLDDK